MFAAFPYFELSFMAPELLSGKAADEQCDLHAAGARRGLNWLERQYPCGSSGIYTAAAVVQNVPKRRRAGILWWQYLVSCHSSRILQNLRENRLGLSAWAVFALAVPSVAASPLRRWVTFWIQH
jgi:hypothetical protein